MDITILDYLEKTEKKFGDKNAYQDDKKSIGFSELVRVGRSIGTYILKNIPMKSAIVVCMKKGVDSITAFWGTVYAGCFYVPIDVQMPLERVEMILKVLNPRMIICDKDGEALLRQIKEAKELVLFEDVSASMEDQAGLDSRRGCMKSTDLLYVLFTSGSTGVPKGVTISHSAVIDFTDWICQKYKMDENIKLCSQAPFYFDASVPDLFIPLKTGACLYIPPKSYYTFPKKILMYIQEKQINTLIWVPSALCNVIRARAFEVCVPDSIKLVIFCGEVMPCKYLNEWRRNVPDALYVNMYGPTEACYACTYYDVIREFRDDEVLPLGKECENSTVLVLGENGLCKTGEIGEICILGQCLSYGYYNAPEKSEKVFVQNPLNNEYAEFMYRTGDLGFVNENGELMYSGRADSQIKRLGHRIELGEIEHAAMTDSKISNCCCIYNEQNSDIIMIFCGEQSVEQLGMELGKKVPAYMMPSKYIKLANLPMNINGKTDRARLKKEYGG